jgi:hypothetical protein
MADGCGELDSVEAFADVAIPGDLTAPAWT